LRGRRTGKVLRHLPAGPAHHDDPATTVTAGHRPASRQQGNVRRRLRPGFLASM